METKPFLVGATWACSIDISLTGFACHKTPPSVSIFYFFRETQTQTAARLLFPFRWLFVTNKGFLVIFPFCVGSNTWKS